MRNLITAVTLFLFVLAAGKTAMSEEYIPIGKKGEHIMSSMTSCFYSIVAALCAAEGVELPRNVTWQPYNQSQSEFLQEFFNACRPEIKDGKLANLIKSMCSKSAETLNKLLKDNGFSIQLREMNENEFGMVGILDLLVEWLGEGKVKEILVPDGRRFPGVELSKGVIVLQANGRPGPVVKIATKSGCWVHMMISKRPKDMFELESLATELAYSCRNLYLSEKYDRVLFPMVSIDQQEDISWILGMRAKEEIAIINQALQQNKLRMNQFGARAQSATAIGVLRGGFIPKETLVIDRPFLVWITKEDILKPLFSAWVDYPDWKDPGDLAKP